MTEETSSEKTTITSGPNGAAGVGEGIDRRIERSWWTWRRIAYAAGTLAVFALIGYAYYTSTGGQALNVETERITISEVTEGPFREYIPVSGSVLPEQTVYLEPANGGRVEEIFVEEGAVLEQGDPILRLSNSDLQLRLLQVETERIRATNQLQSTRFQLQQNSLDMRQQLAEINYEITRLDRQFDREEELAESGAIAREDFEQTRDQLQYQRTRKELVLEAYRQDSLQTAQRIDQMEATLTRLDRNYEVTQQILDQLTVRAPVSGQLTSLDAEIGQMRSSGTQIGRIDVLSGFKLRAQIDEFYIERVRPGQTATTEAIGGEEYELEVTKVYPEVNEGRFQVDLAFTGEPPADLRRGQTIRTQLVLGQPQQATLLPRGGFYQQTGGNWVFAVAPDGEVAKRRYIELGRQNPEYYEVLQGLEPGDRVVTSSYETFGEADRLVLE